MVAWNGGEWGRGRSNGRIDGADVDIDRITYLAQWDSMHGPKVF